MKKGRVTLLLIFVLLVVVGAAYTLNHLYKKEQAPQARFGVETPRKADIVKKSVSSGTIGPRKEISIKPQISGIVDELFVEAGDTVLAGTVLARVRVVPDMAALAAAQSRVEPAESRWTTADVILSDSNHCSHRAWCQSKIFSNRRRLSSRLKRRNWPLTTICALSRRGLQAVRERRPIR
jgi:multidrug efflux pump subunit AcrA (membrane-fusion protein)